MGRANLHKAALEGDTERVKELLKKGADPNIKNKKGRTPIRRCIWRRMRAVSTL
jgi:ankyrin repeat protein